MFAFNVIFDIFLIRVKKDMDVRMIQGVLNHLCVTIFPECLIAMSEVAIVAALSNQNAIDNFQWKLLRNICNTYS